jgi:G8 domain
MHCRCTTAAPAAKPQAPSPVLVRFPAGYADTQQVYHFVDLWSRKSTWGGGPLPVEGDSIVIPANATVLLDIPRGQLPRLNTIILQGNLQFDTELMDGAEPDIHLNVCSQMP